MNKQPNILSDVTHVKNAQHISIRTIGSGDPPVIAAAFEAQGWNKPESQYRLYVEYQVTHKRTVLVALWDGEFAGYLTVEPLSDYPPFREDGIPEIVDFNVLIKFQRRGIGTALMDRAEALIAETSAAAGIGVGMYPDYGKAQILYVKRGYVPDGRGLSWKNRILAYGDTAENDDDLVLHLTKELKDTISA